MRSSVCICCLDYFARLSFKSNTLEDVRESLGGKRVLDFLNLWGARDDPSELQNSSIECIRPEDIPKSNDDGW